MRSSREKLFPCTIVRRSLAENRRKISSRSRNRKRPRRTEPIDRWARGMAARRWALRPAGGPSQRPRPPPQASLRPRAAHPPAQQPLPAKLDKPLPNPPLRPPKNPCAAAANRPPTGPSGPYFVYNSKTRSGRCASVSSSGSILFFTSIS